MNLLIFKAKCPVCPKTVFHVVEPGTKKVEYFEVPETKMLVILATPEIDGKKRIALGPCQRQEPFYREGVEEPVVYFAHVRHGCVPPPVAPGTQMDTSTATVTTLRPGPSSAAYWSAATTFNPVEMPAKMPSSFASRRAIARASSSSIARASS